MPTTDGDTATEIMEDSDKEAEAESEKEAEAESDSDKGKNTGRDVQGLCDSLDVTMLLSRKMGPCTPERK